MTPFVEQCDYLVVGAGTAGMSFVDTLVAENPSAKVILVDRNSRPGGHWTSAYEFAKLQHSSGYYGVNSHPLAQTRDWRGKELHDMYDRAKAAEIVEYYEQVCNKFHATGNVRCFFDTEYMFDTEENAHTLVSRAIDANGRVIRVNCGKLVTVATNVNVPSKRKPLIPVDSSASFVPINEIPNCVHNTQYKKFIVFGNGKTGVDAIIYLLDQQIAPSQITWIISRDVWYFLRESFADFYAVFNVLGKEMIASGSIEDYFLACEKGNVVGRLNPKGPFPEVMKGPIIDEKELEKLRSIETIVRKGRATSIESNQVVLEQGDNLKFNPEDTLLVDCMAQDFYGYACFDENFTIFEPGRINLGPVVMFYNPSYSSAHIAFLECTLKEDSSKNKCCCFLRGKYGEPTPALVVGQFYVQIKTIEALLYIKGGLRFLLTSRTNIGAPFHHKGGLLRLAWFMFGPQQGYNFARKLCHKIESRGFSDLDHFFGVETLGFKGASDQKPFWMMIVSFLCLLCVILVVSLYYSGIFD